MITIDGYYFDGRKPISVPAKIVFEDNEATLIVADVVSKIYITRHLKISPRIGTTNRFITLPNGAQLMCIDQDFLDSLPQESPTEGPVAWLEKRWGVALACVAIILCTLLVAYFFALPVAAERIAARVPMKAEQSLGREALIWLDKKEWFKPTNIEFDKRKNITGDFDRLRSDLPFKEYYHLEFRSSKLFGPNALALPGGTIVITDDMVKTAQTNEEIMAVLAHEIGHVELRHSMRSILQNSAVAAASVAVTSDAASLSAAVAGLPALLAQTKYSREFETAADEFAFKLLKQKGYSPMAFSSIMERLADKDDDKRGAFAYISTHPVTKQRVQRARNAAVKQ